MSKIKRYSRTCIAALLFLNFNMFAVRYFFSPKAATSKKSGTKENDMEANRIVNDEYMLKMKKAAANNNISIPSSNKSDLSKYIIKQGDTLWDLSSAFEIDVDSIIKANSLESPDELKIGQAILIPDVDAQKVASVENQTATQAAKASSAKSASPKKVASRSSSSINIGIWPVHGRISSGFGNRNGKFHKGIDIAAPTGTDVYAYAGGRVVFSGWDNGGYGYLVIISHGSGLETYYAHNSRLLVKTGARVNKGQHIADVGNTGDSHGSHSHFEIRRNGTPVNPLSYLH
ncbi:MAG: M23 family metallopeptidase [Clostridiales bacterium]|nr:M23 family metallopeptidase [Clostridiales bacterium]